MKTSLAPLTVFTVAGLILVASAAQTVGAETKAVVGMSAFLVSEPPELKKTDVRAPYGAVVEILEEKGVGKERVAKTRVVGQSKPLGWIKVEGNLGHVKEFDPAMKPSDSVAVKGLEGLDLTMASIYNARGRYLKEQAAKLGAAPADLAAVLLVESRGRGFDDRGNPITRFENHVFFRRWGDKHKSEFDKHFTFDSTTKYKGHTFRKSESDSFETFHLDNSKEMKVLAFARSLDDTAALQSASYGAAQVMGFNHKTLGYQTVQTMHKDFTLGIRPQLDGMIAYIKNTKACMEGLRERDYFKFAGGYNGKGKEADYSKKIREASESYAKVTKGMNFAD
jgi:hypothetical protein